MLKIKQGKSNTLINLETLFGQTNTERSFIDFKNQTSKDQINPVFDNEKTFYEPLQIKSFQYSISTTFENLSFTNQDILLNTNKFSKSFLRINYYDSNDPANQTLIHQTLLRNQPITNNANQTPTFNINAPSSDSLFKIGYKIPFFKTPNNYIFPVTLYAEYSYLNAVDGKVIRLISNTANQTIENLYNNLYIEHQLIKSGNNYYYTINETNRLIQTINQNKIITLNLLNVI